jgi:hypothetical protein
MSCFPTFTLPAARSGNTWDGISAGSLSSTGTAFADTLASIEMIFQDSTGIVLTLSSGAGTITISDASAWTFVVLPILSLSLSPGNYSWEIKTTDSAGSKKSYFRGTLPVT